MSAKICSSCGNSNNLNEDSFCYRCGHKLAPTLNCECGREIAPFMNNCPSCGKDVRGLYSSVLGVAS